MPKKLEKVQKIALYIVLGKNAHEDYFCNLAILELDTLEGRREKIAFNFAHKLLKNPEHRKMSQDLSCCKTRQEIQKQAPREFVLATRATSLHPESS